MIKKLILFIDNKRSRKIIIKSFNPYFTGSTTSTITVAGEKINIDVFQSLFYWKYHFNYIPVYYQSRD